MSTRRHCLVSGLAGVVILAGAYAARVSAQAQQTPLSHPPGLPTEITQNRFNSGESVIPYYEGWMKNKDGTFDLVFGYFNRNYKEEFAIPAGPDNKVEPGEADRGQPTFFLARRQRFLFRVRVPANFAKGVVTWTITTHGRTEKAYGDLLPAEEITERVVSSNGNFNPGLEDPNKPPSITIAPVKGGGVSTPVTLAASVTDDGLPKPRVAPPAEPRPAPTATGAITAQVNSSGGGRPRGLAVSWMQYGGPAKVTFENAGPITVTNGQATTTARFAAPGTYKLIASANDGGLSTKTELTVTVSGSATP